MKYMLLIHTDPTVDTDPASRQAIMGEYTRFTQSINDSGEFVSGEPLQGPDTATTVRVRNGQVSTTDGPFIETREVLGGYYVVDVKDLDRALELAAQIPAARSGAIDVRPVLDFGA